MTISTFWMSNNLKLGAVTDIQSSISSSENSLSGISISKILKSNFLILSIPIKKIQMNKFYLERVE